MEGMNSVATARILIVDDEMASMRALCDTLQTRGYDVAGFTGGDVALQCLRERQFDLLLTDLMMPGMGGVELLAAALKIDPQVVGIIMTGQGTVATAVEAMKAGAFDYVLKPFKLSLILPVLTRALAVRQLRLDKIFLEENLRKRSAALETANQELEAFSYSVSHDLRAPLRAVNGFAQMLEEDYGEKVDDEGRRLLATVRAGAVQMGRLIDDLLAFSRSGRQTLEASPVDMVALTREAAAQFLSEHPGSKMDISNLPSAIGDGPLLKQVWVNLIGNAFKYSAKAPSPLIEIGGQKNDADVEYWVRDNGAGFDMKYYDKLFRVFQRLHGIDQFPGTGAGLAIVQRIIFRHGGRVWAEGWVGEGAVFHFSLPLRSLQ
jgi:two-component system sensor histidine kinase/response regulator